MKHATPAQEGVVPPLPQGRVSYTAIADMNVSVVSQVPAGSEIMPPAPHDPNPKPVFPSCGIEKRVGGTVGIRIVIEPVMGSEGPSGRVREVTPSPQVVNNPQAPCFADFWQAVVDAVTSWQFRPALLRSVKDGEDYDKDGKPDFKYVVGSKPVAVYVDYRFEFTFDEEGHPVPPGGS